ncbi:MAG: sigma-54 dependent transcriptional regulator [Crocinitomicaceae bacterium]
MADKPFTLFVVEDNEWYNKLLCHNLSLIPNYEVQSFTTGKDALKALDAFPDVVTVDYRLPDMLGSELLKSIKSYNPAIEVIIISEQDEIEVAVELLKEGASDYLVKSKSIKNRLLHTVRQLEEKTGLKNEVNQLKHELQGKYAFEKSIIGASPSIKKVFDLMSKAVTNNITVSISGETGTGKEVVAKAIHYNSFCKDGPFVAVNMAAIPSELIESELFGHEKGAFTGAISKRIGKFFEAQNGTLFLDEIAEMDIHFQAKLLRAIQEKEVTLIGSNKPIKINCRIIVATNKNLQQEVKAGNFREDLYYRLLGLPIHLPPLSERGNDILLLAKYFIDEFTRQNEMPAKNLDKDARSKLQSYRWPGNVRELKSVMELAVVMSDSDSIKADDISLGTDDILPDILSKELSMREYERKIVKLFMERYDQSTKKVAEKLDIGQTTVYRLLKEDE